MNETRDRSYFTSQGWHTVAPRIVVWEARQLVEFVKHVLRRQESIGQTCQLSARRLFRHD